MIGAGGQAGQGDAANLLKPALARGELRTIAATTWAEYKKYFERDAALARRFQVVKVEEPDEKPRDRDDARPHRDAGEPPQRAHPERGDRRVGAPVQPLHLRPPAPDKSVSLLDTACANVAIGQGTVPGVIEDARRRRFELERAIDSLEREQAYGTDHQEELRLLREEDGESSPSCRRSKHAGNKKSSSLARSAPCAPGSKDALTPATKDAEAGEQAAESPEPLSDEDRARLRGELAELNGKLEALQGESPLMHVCVDAQAVAKVVGEWTGIPVGRMVSDEINAVLNSKERMAESVVGQDHALEAIARASRPRAPTGRSARAHRRVHARRHQRRGQDRDRHHAGQSALRRRAEHDRHQHVGVQGRAQSLAAHGLAAGLRRLRRGRRADRGRAQEALQRGAARRDGEGPPRRAGRVLPGVRQGHR